MSWNPSIQFNKLYQAYVSLSTTALTNPMVANLNMNNFAINNAVSVNAVAGATLVLSADAAQGVVVNTKMTIPNHTLVITNNTANDSFRVEDSGADVSTFRIDNDGQVAIRGDPATVLANALTINGTTSATGNIVSAGSLQGAGITSTSTLAVSGTTTLTGLVSCTNGIKINSTNQGIDINNADYVLDATTIKKLYQGIIYSSSQLTAIRNITFPSATVMATEFGANSVVRVSLAQPQGGAGFTYQLIGSAVNNVLVSDASLVYNPNFVCAHRNYDLIIQNILDAGTQRCYVNTVQLGIVP